MKYKFKFEIDYSDMSKEDIRDAKIGIINSDVEMMEAEIDPQIKLPTPEVGSKIVIGNKDYEVTSMKYKMDKDCYTVIFCVTSLKIIKHKRDESTRSMIKAMSRIMK